MRAGKLLARAIIFMATLAAELLNLGGYAGAAARLTDAATTVDYAYTKYKQARKFMKRKRSSIRRPNVLNRRKRRKTGKPKRKSSARGTVVKSSARTSRRFHLGHKPGSSTAKRHTWSDTLVASDINTRALYTQSGITEIPLRTSFNDSMTHRNRDLCNVRGVRLSFSLANMVAHPIYFRMCLVQDRRERDGPNTVFESNDFFKENTFSVRDRDFTNIQNDFQTYIQTRLNPDRFTVLWDKTYFLRQPGNVGEGVALTVAPEGTAWKHVYGLCGTMREVYVPINRQMRFNDNNCQTPLRLLYWCSEFMQGHAPQPAPPEGNSIIGAVKFKLRALTYFREPRQS